MSFLPAIDPNTDVPFEPVGVLTPRDFTCRLVGSIIYLDFAASPRPITRTRLSYMAVYYIDRALVSPHQMATESGYELARRSYSLYIATATLSSAPGRLAVPVSQVPNGGWFWAVSVPMAGATTEIEPCTGAVPIPEANAQTDPPLYQVLSPLVTKTSETIAGVSYRRLLFNWMNPNPRSTFTFLLIVMYNYRNLGQYEELIRLNVPPANGTTVSQVYAGGSIGVGPVYLLPDFDGAHNVTFYFVVENAAKMHDSRLPTAAPAGSYVMVGGV